MPWRSALEPKGIKSIETTIPSIVKEIIQVIKTEIEKNRQVSQESEQFWVEDFRGARGITLDDSIFALERRGPGMANYSSSPISAQNIPDFSGLTIGEILIIQRQGN